ncbi:MAG: hypothetical protein KDC57_12500, partial [Saprospiraceae bacterium]|nr:hypothetical protein [Saprospiraceae bacterium]
APKPINATSAQKFDTEVPATVNYYVFTQYLIILGFTSWFLFNLSHFERPMQLILTTWILLSIANVGAIFERRTWVWLLEWVRYLFTAILIWMLPSPVWIEVSAIVFLIFSAIWFFSFRTFFRASGEVPGML